uniref:Uncharacterized protein n=1 Tax=Romanomermis culicivorax TaxID=13658 RepID=A0A915JF00_ROMCU
MEDYSFVFDEKIPEQVAPSPVKPAKHWHLVVTSPHLSVSENDIALNPHSLLLTLQSGSSAKRGKGTFPYGVRMTELQDHREEARGDFFIGWVIDWPKIK